MPIHSFKGLSTWQKAMQMVAEVYRATAAFPSDERFGLTSQIRRAAVSVPSNIAEGHGRRSRGEFQQFLGNAKGSLCELETQLLIAADLEFLQPESNAALFNLVEEVGRLLTALSKSLDKKRESSVAATDTAQEQETQETSP